MNSTALRKRQALLAIGHCAAAALLSACGTHMASAPSSGALPGIFSSPENNPDFRVDIKPSLIERRVLKSECAEASSDISSLGMASGLMTRPENEGGLYLDKGMTPSGIKWFLVRAKDDPELTYCGIALAAAGNETGVSVANVRRRNMETLKTAVESGDFLCKCKELSR